MGILQLLLVVSVATTTLVLGQLLVPPFVNYTSVLPYPLPHKERGPGGAGKLKITGPAQPNICDPNVKQYSGYFAIEGTNKEYFFWFFESRSNPSTDPTVMWLTGGPGCSSLVAMFGENGPCIVNKDGKSTRNNPNSWNNNANIFWVDQPPGTGFSTGEYDNDEDGVAEDMLQFLKAFFKQYPQYNKNFYVFGESYAGHYVPAITHKIFTDSMKNNLNGGRRSDDVKIDLKGMGIGNGLTDPEEQYKWYPTMAYKSGTAPSVITEEEYNAMEDQVDQCVQLIHACNLEGGLPCTIAFLDCNMALMKPYQDTGRNPYDMRIQCEKPPLCYDFAEVDTFLNNPQIQSAIGVTSGTQWQSCNMAVNLMFNQDFLRNFQQLIPDQVKAGIRTLIYAGDVDFICNWIGNKKWTLALDWESKEAFNSAEDKDVIGPGGKSFGKMRSANGFSFLQVYQAGHMVPMDQPEAALFMLNNFISGKLEEQYFNNRTATSSTTTTSADEATSESVVVESLVG